MYLPSKPTHIDDEHSIISLCTQKAPPASFKRMDPTIAALLLPLDDTPKYSVIELVGLYAPPCKGFVRYDSLGLHVSQPLPYQWHFENFQCLVNVRE
jgi:hypothetical protein